MQNVEIFDENNIFRKFYPSLDSKMKELAHKGLGSVVKTADPINAEDEEKLWDSNVINTTTSSGLSYGVFFTIVNYSGYDHSTNTGSHSPRSTYFLQTNRVLKQ